MDIPSNLLHNCSINSERQNITVLSVMSPIGVALMVLSFVVLWLIGKLAICVWWRPLMLERELRRQGINGPPPLLLLGNYVEIIRLENIQRSIDMDAFRHDIFQRMLPFYTKWCKTYGRRFVFWEACEPRIAVTEPELIREVFSSKLALAFGKSSLHQRCCENLLGKGVAMANGESWAHQRRTIAPAFHADKLKGLAGIMMKCTEQTILRWETSLQQAEAVGKDEVEVEICHDFGVLTADIIACTEFGSSYDKGKRIFDLLTSLQELTLTFAHFVWLPGSRFLPTSWNRETWRLKREMEKLLKEIIEERRDLLKMGKIESYGDDLLGLMLTESEGGSALGDSNHDISGIHSKRDKGHAAIRRPCFTTQQIMDECKTFFFAGHETTAGLLTWCILLLAAYPEWQEKARQEVLEVVGDIRHHENGGRKQFTELADALPKMRTLGMIINETLRLYPPAIVITKYALEDVRIGGDLKVPRGASVWVPVLAMHMDSELWGTDAHLFRPERFQHGVARACKHPLAFMPFAHGPRNCVGQAFAVMEAKIALSIILPRYSFSISPAYRHAPITLLTLKPKHGAQVLLQRIRRQKEAPSPS
ncbi:hypothetical protein KP509_19G049700 [Ceratopteris richardii]|uniref:Cytochrome P450 n=1 Tax=Ceratopteris richardii TaxID=49495 RepID=A0A8T2SPD0_CERRI|nr:hypothetical protein KP509_19G049700 [Ceratopteris richardii]